MTVEHSSQHRHFSQQTPYYLPMLLSLYLAQGLPSGFMTQALPTLLRHYGVSLVQIGLSGLLMLPWAIKFLWSPLVDRHKSALHGHYRSWILPLQFLICVLLVGISFVPIEMATQSHILWLLFVGLFLLNLCCATQDIATDGLAVNILKNNQQHWGNMLQVTGSRLGYLLGGGAVLYFIGIISWQMTFIYLSISVLLNCIMIYFYKEPDFHHQSHNTTLKENKKINLKVFIKKIKQSYGYLLQSKLLIAWLMVLVTYKLADGLFNIMSKPMMIDMGLTIQDIGIYITSFGVIAALIGAVLGALLVQRFSNGKVLLLFSILGCVDIQRKSVILII
ncbi:MFS transporter [Acinetobacter sp. c1-l78]|uniref:MFS transporter n=1 Tax=Acinetobacter sp. c1-l78 TaxID=3342803 RepID=UPI0035BAC451